MIKETTAYEVHTCLADVLERGTADKTFTELGVKKFPLGGKTGTAYNFTDAWFVGYSQRGDVRRLGRLRQAADDLSRRVQQRDRAADLGECDEGDLRRPTGRRRSRSRRASSSARSARRPGLLATDKCFETVENKETGEKVQRRTTFFEIATEEQAPKDGCDVHGGGRREEFCESRSPARNGRGPRWRWTCPRCRRWSMKAPTVLGDDPYNSIQSINNAIAMKTSRRVRLRRWTARRWSLLRRRRQAPASPRCAAPSRSARWSSRPRCSTRRSSYRLRRRWIFRRHSETERFAAYSAVASPCQTRQNPPHD